MVVVAIVAVELGVEDADLGLTGAVEAQRHQRVGQPLAVSALVEVPERKTLVVRSKETKTVNKSTHLWQFPLAVRSMPGNPTLTPARFPRLPADPGVKFGDWALANAC